MSKKIKNIIVFLTILLVIILINKVIYPKYLAFKEQKKVVEEQQRVALEDNSIIQFQKDNGLLSSLYKYSDDQDYSRLTRLINLGLDLENIVTNDEQIYEKLGFNKYYDDKGDQTTILFEMLFNELEYNDFTEGFFIKIIQDLIDIERVDLIKNIRGNIILPAEQKWYMSKLEHLYAMYDIDINIDNIIIRNNDNDDIELLTELYSQGYDFENTLIDSYGNNLLSENIYWSNHNYTITLLESDFEIDINREVPLTNHKSVTCYISSYLINALDGGLRDASSDVVKKILSLDPDINFTQKEIYEYGIENFNYPKHSDISALLHAVYKGWDIEIIKIIVEKGADTNQIGFYDTTSSSFYYPESSIKEEFRGFVSPLILASIKGDIELIKLLVENGADVNLKSSDLDKNAIDFAANQEVKDLLLSYNE